MANGEWRSDCSWNQDTVNTGLQLYCLMKATIEVPDELYRRVKAKAALEGRAVREVTIELYQGWVAETGAGEARPSAEEWLDGWIRLGDSMLADEPSGGTARDEIDAGRDRMEPS